jgi:hypothetical protein
MNPILSIDPGASGGFAWIDRDGITHAEAMPKGMTAQADRLRSLTVELPGLLAVMEKTGTARPTDAKGSAVKFGRHCGNLEAALYVLGIPTEQIPPATWMKTLGALPKDKAERKRAIKEEVARRFPHLTVTLKTADALGLLTHYLLSRTDAGTKA